MTNPLQSILVAINHLVTTHPELAPQVEMIACRAQGKSPEEIVAFREWKAYQNLSAKDVFTKIYQEGHWGRSLDTDSPFYSGTGSHNGAIVDPYVKAVGSAFGNQSEKFDALDIGCGDFNIGSQIRQFFSKYIACDIVSQVVEFNAKKFADLDVDFRVLDVIDDDLPLVDVIFVRQVFQHLSNAQILRAMDKISTNCRYLIVTEHLPDNPDFQPNLDKPNGCGIRLGYQSGVVLTLAPFNLKPVSERLLCEVPGDGGVIRTMLYQLR